jgi:aspartate aminotransferase
MNMFSKTHLSKLEPSSTLLINEQCKAMEKSGKEVFKFGFGQSPFPIPELIVDELKIHAFEKDYLHVNGLLSLRNSIHKNLLKKGLNHFSVTNIFVGPGTKQLMFLLQLAFDGDIILPAPSWVSYEPQSTISKNKVLWIQTKAENNWHVTADEITETLKKVNSKNKIIILNSPNNPSGTNARNLKELSEIFKKNNIIVLSDEIYSDLNFSDNYESIAKYYPEKTIISNGLSKWCGAGGWRLGFFVIPDSLKELNDTMQVLASEAYSSASAPVQYAAIAAYETDQSKFLNHSKKILNLISDYCYKKLNTNKIEIIKPEGGFYVMPDFSKLLKHKYKSSSNFCKILLEETGVAVLPGSDFGFDPEKLIFRLSFVDFDGGKFLNYSYSKENLNEDDLFLFAPKITKGIQKIVDWSSKQKA